MICEHCNEVMRLGVVIDDYSELLFCPHCGRIKVTSIMEGHDVKTQQLQQRTQNKTEEQNRRQNNQTNV